MKSIFKNGVKILVTMVALLALVPSGIVHASSIYDSTVIPAYEWKVVDRDGNGHDTDLAQAINNVSDPQLKTQCQAVYAKFMQMDYRSYDVQHPSRYSAENYARVFGSDEVPGDTQWATSGDLKYAYSLWHNYVGIQLKYDSDASKVVAFDCGDGTNGGSANITYAMAADDGFMIEREYITQNFEVTYPVGYDGESIHSGVISGQISGNVQCANTNNVISAVHINPQSGLDGNAKIINDGMGGVNYRYYLSQDSPYYLTVLCDGDMFTGPTVTSNFYSLYNWVCTNTVPGQDGNLHVCAAS